MFRCFHCGSDIELQEKFSRSDVCRRCGSAIRCCRNCRFYDRPSHNQCLEPAAEWVSDKERSNFCEYFEPSVRTHANLRSEEAKKKWDSLFKK
ncbi:MAG: hypothetical protein AB1756_09610 [Acidobacteriota bacterium]